MTTLTTEETRAAAMTPEAYIAEAKAYDEMLRNAKCDYSDSYKEAHGFRPHTNLACLTVSEIEDLTRRI